MISILNKIMDQIFREEMLSPKAIKSRTIKKMFSGENYDRLSISIPNRIKKKKLPSIRKGNSVHVHKILS